MNAAALLVQIVEAGGGITAVDGRLTFRGVPARLVPLIREHKAALLALLKDAPQSSPPEQAGQCSTPPVSVDPEPAMAPQSAPGPFGHGVVTEHPDGSLTIQYMKPIETTRPPAPRPAPAKVTCGSCAEFEPGPQPFAVGRCSVTSNGLPPVASRGYGCCYPMAPRTCPDYIPLEDMQ